MSGRHSERAPGYEPFLPSPGPGPVQETHSPRAPGPGSERHFGRNRMSKETDIDCRMKGQRVGRALLCKILVHVL